MNKKKVILYSLLAIFALIVLIVIYLNTLYPFPKASKCLAGGGRWTGFSNGCADFCNHGDICTELATLGCDCGPDKCWDGSRCIKPCVNDEECQKYDCDYKTAQRCTENGGRWVQIVVCQAIGCPKAPPPYCECQQKCIDGRCV